ncbi:putative F-box/FBD/LRR-repeat protein At4g03220 [Rosa rugosa]|uniref:putative F-box/FBD/LRR-repeat protein At4g03220 n=1 Tax=Rosa rugosa TaxID=74645 RepID=UPI002B40553E|nr:putative F-box/FBD/LRR-repeat protein At4g03220 [Rosa rugosa]
MGNCFTHKGKASDRWIREEEEENKHHEQRNRISDPSDQCTDAPADRVKGDLSDRWSEEEENKHEKRNSTGSSDRISDLPDDMLHLIFSFLPFKYVGQTSVLSRRWSHVWSSYPIFDFYEIFTGNEAEHHQIRASIINTVLARDRHNENYTMMYPCQKIPLPRGRLGQFCIVGENPNNSCLARVEELVLDISLSSANTSNLPQCQLKCHSLRSSSCGSSKAWLGFPSTYVVWSYLLSLQDLFLAHVDFSDSALGVDLFSGSSFPFLKKLNIEWCRGMTALKICCPNLKDVCILGMDLYSKDISGMRLEELFCGENCIDGWVNIFAPNLQYLYWGNPITEKCSIQSFPTPKRSCIGCSFLFGITKTNIFHNSAINLLSHSSQAEILEILDDYLEILSDIYIEFGGVPFSFGKLETLKIGYTMKQRYIPGIACLLKSSPVVHTLDIDFLSFEENDKWNNIMLDNANCTQEQYWETQAQHLIPFLSHLKVVDIGLGNLISENAITFAKFLLKYGRGLQKMTLSFWRSGSSLPPNSLNDTIDLLKGFPRASADLEFSRYCY